jgi:periplasmic copper chaperone A
MTHQITRRFVLCLTFGLLTTTGVRAQNLQSLVVTGAWTRPAAAGMNAAGYMTITNKGREADQLVGAASATAGSTTLHQSKMVNGVMTMRPVPSLPIAPGAAIALAPGSFHLMLEGLKRPLTVGAKVPVTLSFAHAGPVRVELEVRDAPPSAQMAGMKM